MAKRKGATGVGRRSFLKGAALAGAATTLAAPITAVAQTQARQPAKGKARITAATEAAETGPVDSLPQLTETRSGSDFMVDSFKSLGIEYVVATPGSSFRGLQESFINYGKDNAPTWLTTLHEENSVAMAHGYAKIEGKPLLNLVHATVGLQHASMAMYNAYCDRVPAFVVTANIADETLRRPGVEWVHTAQDGAVITRDFTKWDDAPASLQHFTESTVRAYKIAITPPMGPVVIVADSSLQEDPISADAQLSIPKLPELVVAQGEDSAVAELAKMLVAAEAPVIMADRGVPGPHGVLPHMVELAELLQCAVIDGGSRLNFPTRHGLNQNGRNRAVKAEADLVVGIDMFDFWGQVHSYRDQLHRTSRSILKPGTKTAIITAGDQFSRSNYQDFERYADVDLEISGDGAATLPALVEAVKRLITPEKKRAFVERGKKLTAARDEVYKKAVVDASYGWDTSPITTARMSMELWVQIKDEDWSFVSADTFQSLWPHKLWTMEKHYHFIGGAGGYGVGYQTPAAIGAALANRKHGRITVAFTGDGDLMMSPGSLWTAVKHKIPILILVHNNHAYHQEMMHLQIMAERRMRDIHNAHIGTEIAHPNIDYAKLAMSVGMYGEGPISDPAKLGPAIQRALAVVKRGEPALIDVVSQGR
jgi:acetolactate synthase I/II/III large subunit